MKFEVGVTVTISTSFTVEADNEAEAITKAKALYRGRENLPCPCVDVDWAEEGDVFESDKDAEVDTQESMDALVNRRQA
jgi:hypothetical protein